MKAIMPLLFFILISNLSITPIFAQEPPTDADVENLCAEGQPLDGLCVTELDWECGFEVAAYRLGLREAMPNNCLDFVTNLAELEGTHFDNACYRGGSMAGKCDSDWHWLGGWYLARWEQAGGWFGTYTMPDEFASLLPPQPPPPPQTSGSSAPSFPAGGCQFITSTIYVQFNGGYYLVDPPPYTDATCTTTNGSGSGTLVYAPSGYDPNYLCQVGSGGALNSSLNISVDVYVCLP